MILFFQVEMQFFFKNFWNFKVKALKYVSTHLEFDDKFQLEVLTEVVT